MNFLHGLGGALRRLREKRGWNRTEAAARCERISQSDLSRWEAQERPNLQMETLERLLRGYGADLSELARELRVIQQSPMGSSPAPEIRGEETGKPLKEAIFEVLGELGLYPPPSPKGEGSAGAGGKERSARVLQSGGRKGKKS